LPSKILNRSGQILKVLPTWWENNLTEQSSIFDYCHPEDWSSGVYG
jgi:hypothetical protein